MPLTILLMLPPAELDISPPFSMNGRRGQMGRDLPKPSQLTAKPGSNHGGVASSYGVWCTLTNLWLTGFKRHQRHPLTPTAPLPPSAVSAVFNTRFRSPPACRGSRMVTVTCGDILRRCLRRHLHCTSHTQLVRTCSHTAVNPTSRE